eukprot:Lithocolla_globosa_v1_NODE_7066_length_997_cov_2.650743.p3 type:complete len:101 gc:universal NODE_7066_length_997_cov_2.650743:391-693(+)
MDALFLLFVVGLELGAIIDTVFFSFVGGLAAAEGRTGDTDRAVVSYHGPPNDDTRALNFASMTTCCKRRSSRLSSERQSCGIKWSTCAHTAAYASRECPS